ncbi:MAG TPA: DUF6580 family putative transport protein [Luteolibacter sp.]
MQRHLPLFLLIGLLIAFRILGSVMPESQPNFQPLAALFFCGALMAPGWRGFAIPFAIWAVTYPLASGPVGDFAIISTTLLALVVTFFMGKFMEKRSLPLILTGSIAAALVFHLITNGAAWIGDPMSEKSLSGFWQSFWTGPVNSKTPSWVFLQNSIAANVLFTAIFVGAQLRFPKSAVTSPKSILAR